MAASSGVEGLIRKGVAESGEGSPQKPIVLAVNDTQLVVLVAALVSHTAADPKRAVAYAVDLVAEALVTVQSGALTRAIQAVRDRVAAGG